MRLNARAFLAAGAALALSASAALAQPPQQIGVSSPKPVWLASRGSQTALDVTSAKQLGAAGVHEISTVCVITAGSTVGTVNDSATTGGAALSNQVAAIPNTVGCFPLDWPVFNGLVVVPGTSQVISVSYN